MSSVRLPGIASTRSIRVGVLGDAQGGVAKQRMHGGEAVVAGRGAVVAVALEVLEEGADHLRVEAAEVQTRGRRAGAPVNEREQQPEGVAVGRDRVRAGVPLREQTLSEEGLERGREQGHGSSPRLCSRRSAASASSSGAASKYQYVERGST